jgi:hypothetical protein
MRRVDEGQDLRRAHRGGTNGQSICHGPSSASRLAGGRRRRSAPARSAERSAGQPLHTHDHQANPGVAPADSRPRSNLAQATGPACRLSKDVDQAIPSRSSSRRCGRPDWPRT